MIDLKNSTIIRVEKSGFRENIYIIKCSQCENEIRVSKYLRHSGKCTVCSQRKPPFTTVYNKLKYQSERRCLEMKLSYVDYVNLINEGICHYCGDKLIINPHRNKQGLGFTGYQLDRVDNNKGYINGNCVPCCFSCNNIKSNKFTYEEFIIIAEAIKKVKQKRKQYEFQRLSAIS